MEIQKNLWEIRRAKPLRLDGGVHQLDAVRPDEEEDWQSMVDEEDDPYAFFCDEYEDEPDAAETCESPSALCRES